jgi:tRNA-specific 2-thiouridylase
MRAIDEARDQSYFLFALGQKELSRTLFPLGEMTKGEVRSRARALGLPNADKPDSQEICFVPDGRYADFVTRHASKAELRPGRVVDSSGQMVGEHGGIHNFTVGQRRGLGIARGERLYVREIRTASNEVIVSGRVGLTTRGLMAGQVRLVNDDTASGRQLPIEVKIRYRHPALPATLQMIGPERAEVRFISAGPAVSPGQACVFYRGDDVLGGGFIERAL